MGAPLFSVRPVRLVASERLPFAPPSPGPILLGHDMTFDIDRTAPATGRAEIVIAAPVHAVWTKYTDLADWPDWNSGVEWIGANIPLDPGARFEWRAGGLTIRSCLQAVEPERVIGWTGETLFISARHVTRFADLGAGTRVLTEESFRGAYARLMPGHAARQIEAALLQGLRHLKDACEGRRRKRAA